MMGGMWGMRAGPGAEYTIEKAPRALGFGALTGAFSGFFRIGGGFLAVPGLVASTGMPILNAISSSFMAVAAFGLTTPVSYAFSGCVALPLAFVVVAGGIRGGFAGAMAARTLAAKKGALNIAFACLIFVVAIHKIMIWKSAAGFTA